MTPYLTDLLAACIRPSRAIMTSVRRYSPRRLTMGYRLPDHRPDKKGHIIDLSRQSFIAIDNGAISRISIPCFYRKDIFHDRMRHDHFGWPYPGHPDDSCQLLPECSKAIVLNEIDLSGEGYDSIVVSFLDPPDGLTANGSIDHDTIRVTFISMCPSAKENDIDVQFSIYATGTIGEEYEDEETIQLRDVVTKGILHIVAGSID